MPSHLPNTQAGIIALVTTLVGFLVAFIPSLKTYQAEIISIGGTVVGLVFMIANSILGHANAKVKVAEINANASRSVTPAA